MRAAAGARFGEINEQAYARFIKIKIYFNLKLFSFVQVTLAW